MPPTHLLIYPLPTPLPSISQVNAHHIPSQLSIPSVIVSLVISILSLHLHPWPPKNQTEYTLSILSFSFVISKRDSVSRHHLSSIQNSLLDAPITGSIVHGFEHVLNTTNKMMKVAHVRTTSQISPPLFLCSHPTFRLWAFASLLPSISVKVSPAVHPPKCPQKVQARVVCRIWKDRPGP